jgi:hypothetical protein
MLIVALIVNNLSKHRTYPTWWWWWNWSLYGL